MKDYKKDIEQSVEEEFANFRNAELDKTKEEIFDNCEKILQYKAAYLAVQRIDMREHEAKALYSLKGNILRSIVESKASGGVENV